jgi:hypothetical protein
VHSRVFSVYSARRVFFIARRVNLKKMTEAAENIILIILTVVACWFAFLAVAWAAVFSARAWTATSEPIPADKHPAVRLKRQADTERRIKIMEEPDIFEVVDERFVCKENDCGNGEVDWEVSYTERRE